ncbi:hypothetical protein Lal_00003438 [Lupinus albus]|nr:hypothetical protein Lal_00003438 [Lupinus albus]
MSTQIGWMDHLVSHEDWLFEYERYGWSCQEDFREKVDPEREPGFICIQETKRELIESKLCYVLWPDIDVDWIFQPSVGNSGGLLSLWMKDIFQIIYSLSGKGFLDISGHYWNSDEVCRIVNVYSPYGDFNSVKTSAERKGCDSHGCFKETWIHLDLPLTGRRFTWIKGDGKTKSRLDRFLIYFEWDIKWPGFSFSDSGGLLCSFCNDEPKSSTHLFSSCKAIYSVWQLLYNWLNISIALPQSPLHHYSYHLGMVPNKKGRKSWSIIWLATVWAIWKHQNEVIFNKVKPSTTYILDAAKMNV